MNSDYFKRRYLDLRLGGVTINPLIQASNFVMISYILIQEAIPFWLYAPLFLSCILTAFTATGLFFRKIQLSTDEDLKYEKQIELNKTLLEIMKALSKNKQDESFYLRMDELEKIIKK